MDNNRSILSSIAALIIFSALITACSHVKHCRYGLNFLQKNYNSYLVGKIIYYDSSGDFYIRIKRPYAPKNHNQYDVHLHAFGFLTVNKDTTEIHIKNPINPIETVIKKSILGWYVDGAYKIRLRNLEFTEAKWDHEFSFNVTIERLQKRIQNVHNSEIIELNPIKISKSDTIISGIVLLQNNRYVQVDRIIIFSKGRYSIENGFLILVEDRTENEYRLKAMNQDTIQFRRTPPQILEEGTHVFNMINNFPSTFNVYKLE